AITTSSTVHWDTRLQRRPQPHRPRVRTKVPQRLVDLFALLTWALGAFCAAWCWCASSSRRRARSCAASGVVDSIGRPSPPAGPTGAWKADDAVDSGELLLHELSPERAEGAGEATRLSATTLVHAPLIIL
ncbi:unnamed protein product, partial [Prorocentrum cordatum]